MALIVDMTGPCAAYGGRLLAEQGHRVVRLEPTAGDAVRREDLRANCHNFRPSLEAGPMHRHFNAGKLSLALDAENPDSKTAALQFIRTADAAMVGGEALVGFRQIKEYCSDVPCVTVIDEAPEGVLLAESGLLSLTGHPGSPPAGLGGHATYSAIGTYVAITAASLILMRGVGPTTDAQVSARQALETLVEQAAIQFLDEGVIAEREGLRGAITAVSGIFEAADGYWAMSLPPSEPAWRSFLDWLDEPEALSNEDFADEAERFARREEIHAVLEVWSKRRTKRDIVATAQALGLPATEVTDPEEIAKDPQLQYRRYFADVGGVPIPRGTCSHPDFTPRAPLLGEHSAALLSELGYSKRMIHRLTEDPKL